MAVLIAALISTERVGADQQIRKYLSKDSTETLVHSLL